ncbi:uncharacterized protein UHOD_11868 [Ustilago sp. UG-2017b]|nr:uncharacterized protein UHOD_11868 [Ustilago sp. UG-2017b]
MSAPPTLLLLLGTCLPVSYTLLCHGSECTGSKKALGSYGRSIGVRDQADPQRSRPWPMDEEMLEKAWSECNLHGECSLHGDHGHGGLGPYARRSKHCHNEDRAQGAYRWFPLRGSRDKSQRNRHQSKEEEQWEEHRYQGSEEDCHGSECTGSKKALGSYGRSIGVRDQADPQRSRPWPMDEEMLEKAWSECNLHGDHGHGGPGRMHGGPSTATRRTELKEHTDGYHLGAPETRVKGTITGQREGAVYRKPASRS